MQQVTVNKMELLGILKDNREKHRKVFEEACDGYRLQAIAELDKMLAEAKAGSRIRRSLALVEPQDQTKEYDRAIRMLELEVEDTVTLQEHEFAQYVMDEWRWTHSFTTSNVRYVHSPVGSAYLKDKMAPVEEE